jgi:uncharacterized phiE125 gp8 family phage protein
MSTIVRYGLKRSVDSVGDYPVTVSEAKSHLRIDSSDDDSYISALVGAARNIAENYTNRSFYTQTWVMTLPYFPYGSIELKRGEVQSITSLKYYDSDNSLQTWDATNYRLDNSSDIGLIEPSDGWPSNVYERSNAVEITYITGWTSHTLIPSAIKQACLLIIGHLYENRQDVVIGSQVNEMPQASKYLLDPYRIYHVAK